MPELGSQTPDESAEALQLRLRDLSRRCRDDKVQSACAELAEVLQATLLQLIHENPVWSPHETELLADTHTPLWTGRFLDGLKMGTILNLRNWLRACVKHAFRKIDNPRWGTRLKVISPDAIAGMATPVTPPTEEQVRAETARLYRLFSPAEAALYDLYLGEETLTQEEMRVRLGWSDHLFRRTLRSLRAKLKSEGEP